MADRLRHITARGDVDVEIIDLLAVPVARAIDTSARVSVP